MNWICDRVLQGYGIASSFVSGFIELISELLGWACGRQIDEVSCNVINDSKDREY